MLFVTSLATAYRGGELQVVNNHFHKDPVFFFPILAIDHIKVFLFKILFFFFHFILNAIIL